MHDLNKINIGHCRSERKMAKREKRYMAAVVSTCCYSFQITWDRSRSIGKDEYVLGMIEKFQEIGGLGNRSNNTTCKNTVGCCAEQHAANTLAKRIALKSPFYQHIEFSDARRPRTLEIIKSCKNCKKLFNI